MITEAVRALFRADQTGRYEMDKSFVVNRVRYSTDGWIILCEPAPKEPDTEGRFPNPSSILAPYDFNGGEWFDGPLPAPKERPKTACESCGGTGVEHVACPHCAGKVDVGAGEDCPECEGAGKVDDDAVVVLAPECWVAVCYTWLINQLPNVKWRMTGKDSPVLFKCDGGYGLTMPVDFIPEAERRFVSELRFYKNA